MTRRELITLSCLALTVAAGCLRPGVSGTAGLKEMARTELYFGLAMPDAKTVSEAEWQAFVDQHIAPRFKDGLTVVDARGQCLTKAKKLVHENVKVVILVHPDTPAARIAVFNIISAYKDRFRQESVLRVTDKVGVSR